MSIAVLAQVYDEARRLAVAGSVVAAGDFRLKKLIPPLEQAGAKTPVFGKVAEAARAVVEGPEDQSAENLLELTSLVSAVLYTQGETGLAGEVEPIPSVNLGGELAQTPARVLKPLLEALTGTGSGRGGKVREAHQQGAFRDLRLVKPALNGLDDPYAEVADFLAQKVLPIYGTAILPELKGRYDPSGTKGHPRRLKLMHALDPDGTRELVKAALDGKETSKDVRIAAIGLLGPEDLDFLVEQAGSKTQDVREAAYTALGKIDDPKALAVLEKAFGGKDFQLALNVVSGDDQPARLTDLLVSEARKGLAALTAAKTKKLVGEAADRLTDLLRVFPVAPHPGADALTRELFDRRAELAKIKGDTWGGEDVAEAALDRMEDGPKPLAEVLARAHAELEPRHLDQAFRAARRALPPAEVYALFSPYLTAAVDEKKKGKNPAKERRDEVVSALHGYDAEYAEYDEDDDWDDSDLEDDGPRRPDEKPQPPDPRWLDLAVGLKNLNLVDSLARPDHPGALAFAWAEYEAAFKKKDQDAVRMPLMALVKLGHPRAAEALVAAYERAVSGKKIGWVYWYYHLIPRLPRDAAPLLEAVVPTVKNPDEAERLAEAVQELKEKKEPGAKAP